MSTDTAEQSDVKTFRGQSLEELLPRIREELGPDAVILRQRDGLMGGVGGFFQKRCVEVDARAGAPRVDAYDDGEAEARAALDAEPAWDRGGEAPRFTSAVPPALPAESEASRAGDVGELAMAEGMQSPAIRALFEAAAPFAEQLKAADAAIPPADPAAGAPRAEPPTTEAPAAAAEESTTEEPASAPTTEAPAAAAAEESTTEEPAGEPAEAPKAAPAEEPAAAAPAATAASPAGEPAEAPKAAPVEEPADTEPFADVAPFADAAPFAEAASVAEAARADAEDADEPAAPEAGGERPASADATEIALVDGGLSPELAADVVAETVSHLLPFGTPRQLKRLARTALARQIPAEAPRALGGETVAFVGAGGSGKTLTTARVAAAYAAASDLPVVCLSLRPRDGGASLRALLEPAGVDVEVVETAAEARDRAAAAGRALVVVDTPAVSPSDAAGLRALAAELRTLGSAQAQVCVPATLSASAAGRLLEAMAPLRPAGIVLTHVDETPQVGQIVELSIAGGPPLSFVGRDTELEGGLALADPAALAALILP